MQYLWRDTSFQVPDGLVDRSVILLTDDSDPDAELNVSFAVDALTDATDTALSTYVDEAIREATARLHALRVSAREAAVVNDRPVIFVVQTAAGEPGQSVLQHQAFVRDGAAMTLVSVTSEVADEERARKTLHSIVSSLKRVTP